MDDSTLFKIAAVGSAVSLLVLLLLSAGYDGVEGASLAKASKEGEKAVVSGTVEGIYSKEGFTILTLKTTERIKVVAFDNISVSKGDFIRVKGTTRVYEGQVELLAMQVEVD